VKETREERDLRTGEIVSIAPLPYEMLRNSSNYKRRLLDMFVENLKEEKGTAKGA
jgi:hypothetical protein